MVGKGGEVVTREPYRKARLDHLLSREIPSLEEITLTFLTSSSRLSR